MVSHQQYFLDVIFFSSSQIRLVGGGAENDVIKEIIQSIVGFERHIQRTQTYGRSYEWKVSGNPFSGDVFSDQRSEGDDSPTYKDYEEDESVRLETCGIS